MINREELLTQLKEGLSSGVVSVEDIKKVAGLTIVEKERKQDTLHKTQRSSVNAVDAMFYIGGLILFIAQVALIGQSWDSGNALGHVSLSAGVGFLLWFVAYVLKQSSVSDSDIKSGLANSMILSGSLGIIAGGYVILNEVVNGFSELNLIGGGITLTVLGMAHYAYDKLVHNLIPILLSVLLIVLAFPAFLFGILGNGISNDVSGIIIIITSVVLALSGRVIVLTGEGRSNLRSVFYPLSSVTALLTMYVLGFTSVVEGFWQLTMIVAVLGGFYISIVTQSKDFLNVSTAFLILFLLTVSFRYFSDAGLIVSLFIAATSVIGTAIIASTINKKYINH